LNKFGLILLIWSC